MRRITIALLAVTVSVIASTASAGAAPAVSVTPGSFTFDVTTAKVGIGPVPSIPINPTTVGQKITITGTVDQAGHLTATKDKLVFPVVNVPIPDEVISSLVTALTSGAGTSGLDLGSLLGSLFGGTTAKTNAHTRAVQTRAGVGGFDLSSITKLIKNVSVDAGVTPTSGATGAVNTTTGATSLSFGLGVGVGLNATVLLPIKNLVSCGISPLNFALTTGTSTVPGGTATVSGVPRDASTGIVTLAGATDSPAPACTLNALLKGLLGTSVDLSSLTSNIPALGPATLSLTGKLDVTPAKVSYIPDPIHSTKPPVALATLKIAKTIKVTGKTLSVKVACANADCAGKVAVRTKSSKASTAKVKTYGSKSYRAKAGKSATVKVTLSSAARRLLKKQHKAKVAVTVSVAGGTGAQKTVTLTAPAAKKKKKKK
jgi:hypothetical protein